MSKVSMRVRSGGRNGPVAELRTPRPCRSRPRPRSTGVCTVARRDRDMTSVYFCGFGGILNHHVSQSLLANLLQRRRRCDPHLLLCGLDGGSGAPRRHTRTAHVRPLREACAPHVSAAGLAADSASNCLDPGCPLRPVDRGELGPTRPGARGDLRHLQNPRNVISRHPTGSEKPQSFRPQAGPSPSQNFPHRFRCVSSFWPGTSSS